MVTRWGMTYQIQGLDHCRASRCHFDLGCSYPPQSLSIIALLLVPVPVPVPVWMVMFVLVKVLVVVPMPLSVPAWMAVFALVLVLMLAPVAMPMPMASGVLALTSVSQTYWRNWAKASSRYSSAICRTQKPLSPWVFDSTAHFLCELGFSM